MTNDSVKYLVFDVETVPDGKLIIDTKYPELGIDEDAAIDLYKKEIRTASNGVSDFIPVTYQYPVSICVAKVSGNYELVDIVSLDAPHYRTESMVRLFWSGMEDVYKDASWVTFNGRTFDVPLLELMAYRFGCSMRNHFRGKDSSRYRYGSKHIDLQEFLTNFNAFRLAGGLDLLAKILGKPGKMDVSGARVHELYKRGMLREISDYCMHDVLDTYFVFLRTRVMLGDLTVLQEFDIIKNAIRFIENKREQIPALNKYLEKINGKG